MPQMAPMFADIFLLYYFFLFFIFTFLYFNFYVGLSSPSEKPSSFFSIKNNWHFN